MLFTPARIGTLELRNRMVRSATAERMATSDGTPLPELIECHRALAHGGTGLIITGHMYVHPTGIVHPQMVGIDSDDRVEGLAALADAVHGEGGHIAVQLNHSGRQARASVTEMAIAPSDDPAAPPRAAARKMTDEEIAEIIEAYAQAARRVSEAGFDAVQIHAAHGFLISQFLSPLANQRTDGWGGSLRNRMRFLASVVGAVRREVGDRFPVFAKLGLCDESEGGLTLEEGIQILGAAKGMGLDAVEISGGIGTTGAYVTRKGVRAGHDEAYLRPWAQQAKDATSVPTILVGGLRSRAVMEEVLESGDAQFISLCRPLVCEPDLANRLAEGESTAARCISANRCWPESSDEYLACRCFGE